MINQSKKKPGKVSLTLLFILSSLISLLSSAFSSNLPEKHKSDGNRSNQCIIETIDLQIPQLGNRHRTVVVCLPQDYYMNSVTYPVIFVQDGQDLFQRLNGAESERIIDPNLYEYYSNAFGIQPIIVGIEFDWKTRWDEYSPWPNSNMYSWTEYIYADKVEGGEGDAYIDFLIHTLKPKIDERYRTEPNRESTAIAGETMGGLISLYAGLTEPETFSKVLALSPAVWFAEEGGPWLSNNQLIKLILKSELSKDVTYHFGLIQERKTKVFEKQLAIYDKSGKQITYDQAYKEGIEALTKALTTHGIPKKNIQALDSDSSELIESVDQPFDWQLQDLIRSEYQYYLPIIYKPYPPGRIESFSINMWEVFGDQVIGIEGRTREIHVYLPPDYDSSSKVYPVIYLQDGQSMFDDEWRANEILDTLFFNEDNQGIIAVAIEAAATHRWDEYSPWINSNMYAWVSSHVAYSTEGGEGEKYLEFVTEILKKYIDINYRTLPDSEHTAIGGSSMGGLIATYAGLKRPDVFSKVMAMSSAVWFAEDPKSNYWLYNNRLENEIKFTADPSWAQKYYIYVGDHEVMELGYPIGIRFKYPPYELLTYPLVYKSGSKWVNYDFGIKGVLTKFDIYESTAAIHNPSAWRLWFDDALLWLFSD